MSSPESVGGHFALGPPGLGGDLGEAAAVAIGLFQLGHARGDDGARRGLIEGAGAFQGLGVEAGDHGVSGVEPGRDESGGKARSARAGPFGLDQGHGTPLRTRARATEAPATPPPITATEAGGGGGLRLGQPRLQPFALAAMAGAFVDLEAALRQAAPHGPGDGEGGDPRARRRPGRDPVHDGV
jgi:hypothetical protein